MSETNRPGLWPVMLTPFTDEGEVDYSSLERLIDWYEKGGATGLFADCQSSEIFFLSLKERAEIARFVVSHAHVPVIASGHVSEGFSDQLEELKLIASSGPDSAARILSASLEGILEEGGIKSVGISGSTAKIDLSGELYARAQSLNEKDEMLLIFALVNSAHLNLGAQSVLFTVVGRKAETFAGHIPLDGPLHPNFGLMK